MVLKLLRRGGMPLAKICQIALFRARPGVLCLWRWQAQPGSLVPASGGEGAKTKPTASLEIQAHQSLPMARLQRWLAGGARTGEQSPHTHLSAGQSRQALQDLPRGNKLPHPQSPGETPLIHHQGEREFKGCTLLPQALQSEEIGQSIGGMATVQQLFQAVANRRTQPLRSPQEHPLPHRLRSSRHGTPALAAPSTSSG